MQNARQRREGVRARSSARWRADILADSRTRSAGRNRGHCRRRKRLTTRQSEPPTMKNAHFDPELGYTHAHLTDNGDIELHRDSRNGHTTFDLGQLCAVKLAIDILRLTNHA